MTIFVCSPQPIKRRIVIGVCPDCKKRTRFLCFCVEWYGWGKTCLRCGREWNDGEWTALPFERGARQNNIAAAKRRWRKQAERLNTVEF